MKMAEAFVSVCLYSEQREIEENISRCWRRNSGKEERWPKSSSTRTDPLNISFPPFWRSGKLVWAILSWEEMVDLMWRRAVGLDPFPPSVRRVILGGRAKGMAARHPISSFHTVHGSTSGALNPNCRKWHHFQSLQMCSELRNSMIQKSKGMRRI